MARSTCPLLLVLLVVVCCVSTSAWGFSCDDVTSWPRDYSHYGEDIKQYSPRMASNGSSFLVAWYEQFYYSESVVGTKAYASFLDQDGVVLTPSGLILADDTYSYNTNQEPAACVVGEDYWVFYGLYGLTEYVYARSVSEDSTVGDAILVGHGTGMETITSLAAAAIDGGNVIAAWLNPGGIDYSLLTPAGDLLIDSASLVLNTHVGEHLAAAASGSAFVVVYYDTDADCLYAVMVDDDGTVGVPIAIDSYNSYVSYGVFDVIPYHYDGQDGWLVAYDRGWTWGSIRGRFVGLDGTVSEELFWIDDPTSKHWGDNTLSVVETGFGLQLAWSSYDWIFSSTSGVVQYGTVYHLDPAFEVVSQDVLPEPCPGSQLCLVRNDFGRTVAVWSQGLDWVFSDYPVRKLVGGAYAPDTDVLVSGSTQCGYLDVAGVDVYGFAADGGESATILMGDCSDDLYFDPRVELHAPDGTVVATEWGPGMALIEAQLPEQSGTYYVVCREYNGTDVGDYCVSLLLNPGSPNSAQDPDGGPIESGETLCGNIGCGDLDAMTFEAVGGEWATIVMAHCPYESLLFDAEVELHAPDGTVVATNWGPGRAMIEAQLPEQTGTYYVVCREYGGTAAGDYCVSLLLNTGSPNSAQDPDGGPIESGETLCGSIACGDLDAVTFEALGGESATILMGDCFDDLYFHPQLELHAPDGTVVAADWAPGRALIEAHLLEQSGTYYVVCRERSLLDAGEYCVSLLLNPGSSNSAQDPDGGPIESGQTLCGSIGCGDLDAATFEACAGDTVMVVMSEETPDVYFDPQVAVHAPDGTVVATEWGPSSATIGPQVLDQSGTYYVVCREYGGTAVGDYCVSLTLFPGPGGAAADFAGSPTSGCAPLSVQFTDLSAGSPTSWLWEFGDGGTSAAQHPAHTYENEGSYTVSLTVANDCGDNTETKTDYITASGVAPVAEFSGSPTSGPAPLTVDFTDLSSNSPTSWSWDFGDTGSSTDQNPSHEYTTAGTYTVSLTASNDCGQDTEAKADYITAPPPAPVADFSGLPTSGAAPLEVDFTDLSTNSPTAWAWDFGDTGSSTLQDPSHEYAAAGSYTVSLTATNDGGSDSETKVDYLHVTPSECATLGAVSAEDGAGSVARVPVVLELGDLQADRFAFSAQVTANGSAPPLGGDLGFEAAPGLPPPGLVSPSGDMISVAWMTTLSEPVTGTVALGDILVPIAAEALPGDTYSICMLSVGASLGTEEICVDPGSCATLTVCAEVLVGDAYPELEDLNQDGDACDAGEFGDDDLTWGDVITVFDAWAMPGSFPCEAGTDRFCAMDSYPQDTEEEPGGDGALTWGDVITTFDRWANPSLPRPWRPLCECAVPGPAADASSAKAALGAAEVAEEPGLWIGDGSGAAGSTVRLPVMIDLGDQDADRMALSVELIPAEGTEIAAAINRFEAAEGLEEPVVLTMPEGGLGVAWLVPMEQPLSEIVSLGELVIEVPAEAGVGDAWGVYVNAVGASLGDEELDPQVVAGEDALVMVALGLPHDVSIRRFQAPRQAKVGSTRRLSIDVENLTDTPESVEVRLLRNGVEEQPQSLLLEGLDRQHVVFFYTFAPGDRPSLTFTVEAILPPPGDTNPEDNTASVTVIVR